MINTKVHELVIPIPPSLIDELAQQVADKVVGLVGSELREELSRLVETKLEGRAARIGAVEVTFLRLSEMCR